MASVLPAPCYPLDMYGRGKKYNNVAAQIRILESRFDTASPWPTLDAFSTIDDFKYARAQLVSHAVHMNHDILN